MRTLKDIDDDIRRLARPTHPGCAGALNPKAIAAWREARDAWRNANPTAEERYALLLEERDATEAEMVRRQARRDTKGIPPRTRSALLQLRETPALKAARQWLDGTKHWLVLGGDIGTGKSVAAAWALDGSPGSGAWVSAAGFVTLLGGFSGQAECERLKHVDTLVVDDFGTEHMSDFAASVFHEVLAARHENENRTVLTHNLSREVLRLRLGSRLADRIASDCVYVECAGESLRRAS